jgi:hypothetical protein
MRFAIPAAGDGVDAGALETVAQERIERGVDQLLVAQRRPAGLTPGGSVAGSHCSLASIPTPSGVSPERAPLYETISATFIRRSCQNS